MQVRGSGAHPWLLEERTGRRVMTGALKGHGVSQRRRLRDLAAMGWTIERRSNTMYPRHRQFRVRSPAAVDTVDLHARTCTCGRARPAAASGGGSSSSGSNELCDHLWFAAEMETRSFAVPTAEWDDPEPAVTWRDKVAQFHSELASSRASRAREEAERLEHERERRARLAKEREKHFHTTLPTRPPRQQDERDRKAEEAEEEEEQRRRRESRRAEPNPFADFGRRRAAPPPAPAAPAPGASEGDGPAPKRQALEPWDELAGVLRANLDQWHALESRFAVDRRLIPWLPESALELLAAHHARVEKPLLRSVQVVWHPDRFSQHFAAKVTTEDLPDLLAAVNTAAQRINGILSRAK
jgi:hypothetical protein